MAVTSAKKLLRKELKQKLAFLTETEKVRQSNFVVAKLLETDEYQKSRRISVFLSMQDEIRTEGILKDIFKCDKECFIPRYIGAKMTMVKLYSMEDYDSLPETSWKIKQPTEDDPREDALLTGGLDLILMPGLGFTRNGARLGRGKGYYDTYLSKCAEVMGRKPLTIALAFSQQLCDHVPTDDTDVLINKVLFEDMATS